MARPRKEGMDYFPHDTDAANDEKVEALTSLYGANGYAFCFIMLERIYRQSQAELDVSDPETKAILAKKCLTDLDAWQAMLHTALKVGFFDRATYEAKGVLKPGKPCRRRAPDRDMFRTPLKQWQRQVFERDNYRCQKCGSEVDICAHHIKSWRNYPELRFLVSNGITLCTKCHNLAHKRGED